MMLVNCAEILCVTNERSFRKRLEEKGIPFIVYQPLFPMPLYVHRHPSMYESEDDPWLLTLVGTAMLMLGHRIKLNPLEFLMAIPCILNFLELRLLRVKIRFLWSERSYVCRDSIGEFVTRLTGCSAGTGKRRGEVDQRMGRSERMAGVRVIRQLLVNLGACVRRESFFQYIFKLYYFCILVQHFLRVLVFSITALE